MKCKRFLYVFFILFCYMFLSLFSGKNLLLLELAFLGGVKAKQGKRYWSQGETQERTRTRCSFPTQKVSFVSIPSSFNFSITILPLKSQFLIGRSHGVEPFMDFPVFERPHSEMTCLFGPKPTPDNESTKHGLRQLGTQRQSVRHPIILMPLLILRLSKALGPFLHIRRSLVFSSCYFH